MKKKKTWPIQKKQTRPPSAPLDELMKPRDWGTKAPPPYVVRLIGLEGQPNREVVDVETHPALTPAESDHLLNVIVDYMSRIGRGDGLVAGFRRSEAEVSADAYKFLVVQQGQTWEQRKAEFAEPGERPNQGPAADKD